MNGSRSDSDQRARYRQLADSLEEGWCTRMSTGVITFANAAAERILMLAKDPANGRIVTHPHWACSVKTEWNGPPTNIRR